VKVEDALKAARLVRASLDVPPLEFAFDFSMVVEVDDPVAT